MVKFRPKLTKYCPKAPKLQFRQLKSFQFCILNGNWLFYIIETDIGVFSYNIYHVIQGIWDPSGWEAGQIRVKIDENLAKIPKLCIDGLLTLRKYPKTGLKVFTPLSVSTIYDHQWPFGMQRDYLSCQKFNFEDFGQCFVNTDANLTNFSQWRIPNTLKRI